MKKFKHLILASTVALSSMTFIPLTDTQQASASEISNTISTDKGIISNSIEANTSTNDVDIIKLNDSSLQLDFINGDVNVEFGEYGEITLTNGEKSEVLPTYAIDENNQYVQLVYKQVENGLIVELHQDQIMLYSRSSKPSKWKCALGTLGGYYSGAVVGGGTGAAAGSIVPGLGTVAGGVGGAIAGAIGGGMTGAAASCF